MHFNVLSWQLVPKMVVLLVVSLTNLNKVTKRKPTKLKVWDARMKVSGCICCTQTMTLFGSFSKDTSTLEEASLTQNQDVHASEPRSGLGAAAKAGPVRVPTDFQELQRLISVWGPTDMIHSPLGSLRLVCNTFPFARAKARDFSSRQAGHLHEPEEPHTNQIG